jgi:hypothetical protein
MRLLLSRAEIQPKLNPALVMLLTMLRNRQLRVTDNVRKQHMRDLELNFLLNLGSHDYFGAPDASF